MTIRKDLFDENKIKRPTKEKIEDLKQKSIDQINNFTLKENKNMSVFTIGLIAFLSGAVVTGGAVFAIDKNKQGESEQTSEIITAISGLETKVDQAKATAIVNLTAPDLLKVPCSYEYIYGKFDEKGIQIQKGKGDMLCREMFCRMNRQQGEGASGKECDEISNIANSVVIINSCMQYWEEKSIDERGSLDQNSKYVQCINLFAQRK
jgi:hypothetical protein